MAIAGVDRVRPKKRCHGGLIKRIFNIVSLFIQRIYVKLYSDGRAFYKGLTVFVYLSYMPNTSLYEK
jgi:hypothetical protein